jgi:putative heme degradation protein
MPSSYVHHGKVLPRKVCARKFVHRHTQYLKLVAEDFILKVSNLRVAMAMAQAQASRNGFAI